MIFLDERLTWRDDGIAVDVRCAPAKGQEQEHELRDAVAAPFIASRDAAVHEATRHHSRGVMLRRAADAVEKARKASGKPVVVDLGCGFGWHWMELAAKHHDVQFVLVDFAITNLRVARNLMPEATFPNVFCLQASITDLPIHDASAQLAWTVQVLQHLPPPERAKALGEMRRILAPRGAFYIAWVRPVPVLAILGRLLGRRYHLTGMMASGMWLDRFSTDVALQIKSILPEVRMSVSESLFHPELRLRPRASWIGTLDLIISKTPLGRLLARQAEVSGTR